MRPLLPILALAVLAAGCASPDVNQQGESSAPHDTGTGPLLNCATTPSGDVNGTNISGQGSACGNTTTDTNLR